MNTKTMQGKCLCGAVSISAKVVKEVDVCHCGMCRRWGGAPFMSIQYEADVEISGVDNIKEFESSGWALRAFCNTCGTHLFYRFKPANQLAISAGLFQEQDGFKLINQIFIDKKPDYYDFSNVTKNLTETEVFQNFDPNATSRQ